MNDYGFSSISPIAKGWSSDNKYCVVKDGKKYLFRTSSMDQYNLKWNEFEMMKKLSELQVPMCQPIEFGTLDHEVYSLQSWIEGINFEEAIHTFKPNEQYDYGVKAGKILKIIHSIPAPLNQEDWESRFNRKINHKMINYQKCPRKYDQGALFLKYIEEHRMLLRNRPQTFQHGDYHIGNFMLNEKEELIVIDFNRYDFGDPWEDFNRIVWCIELSPMFASGMVNGYFKDDVPLDFWKLLAFYISSNTLSSLPWAIPFGDKEVEIMINQAENILKWYDNMNMVIPSWYCAST